MATEIERKYLVRNESWRGAGSVTRIRQGYLSTDPDRVVRVRVAGDRGYLTVKGRATGARRAEFEFEVPSRDAEQLLALCLGSLVEKDRHRVLVNGFSWEVDEFVGENSGLVVAELEVDDEADFDHMLESPPTWLGRDVTADGRLSNARLSAIPFSRWSAEERAPYFFTSSEIARG